MKKIFVSVLLVLIGHSITTAQNLHYGIVAGANLNKMKLDTQYHINEDTERNPLALGFQLGGFAEYMFNKSIGIQCDVFYTEYGNNFTDSYKDETGSLDQKAEIQTKNIGLALMFKCYLFKQHLAVDLGVQPSYSAKVRKYEECIVKMGDFSMTDDTTYYLKKDKEFNPITLAAIGGLTYYIRENIFFSARYIFGLTDLFKKEVLYVDPEPHTEKIKVLSKNRVIQLGLGWRF